MRVAPASGMKNIVCAVRLSGLLVSGVTLVIAVGCGGSTAPDQTPTASTASTAPSAPSAPGAVTGGGDGACPASATRPHTGDPCTSEGLFCQLGKNTTGCDSDSAECRDGKWSVIGTPGCPGPIDGGVDADASVDVDADASADTDAGQ